MNSTCVAIRHYNFRLLCNACKSSSSKQHIHLWSDMYVEHYPYTDTSKCTSLTTKSLAHAITTGISYHWYKQMLESFKASPAKIQFDFIVTRVHNKKLFLSSLVGLNCFLAGLRYRQSSISSQSSSVGGGGSSGGPEKSRNVRGRGSSRYTGCSMIGGNFSFLIRFFFSFELSDVSVVDAVGIGGSVFESLRSSSCFSLNVFSENLSNEIRVPTSPFSNTMFAWSVLSVDDFWSFWNALVSMVPSTDNIRLRSFILNSFGGMKMADCVLLLVRELGVSPRC